MSKVRRLLAGLCAAVLLLSLSGCRQKETLKRFECDGFSIKLPESFREHIPDDAALYDYAFTDGNVLVSVLREDFALLETSGLTSASSLEDYIQSVLDGAGYTDQQARQGGKGAYRYFTYEKESGGQSLRFLGAAFKGKDAFWFVNFVCPQKEWGRNEDRFLSWADTAKLN